ncbi:hypothetical protein C8F01DRAFT_1379362 [Mycena amicta]|nr:hypothetical protein C8F01DRAFT_1379362 [Mycena amicta]
MKIWRVISGTARRLIQPRRRRSTTPELADEEVPPQYRDLPIGEFPHFLGSYCAQLPAVYAEDLRDATFVPSVDQGGYYLERQNGSTPAPKRKQESSPTRSLPNAKRKRESSPPRSPKQRPSQRISSTIRTTGTRFIHRVRGIRQRKKDSEDVKSRSEQSKARGRHNPTSQPRKRNRERSPSAESGDSIPHTLESRSSLASDDEWDHWPTGHWKRRASPGFFDKFKFATHWASQTYGTGRKDKHRSADGQSTGDGARTVRGCLGIYECTNPKCRIAIRPQSKKRGRDQQQASGCPVCRSEVREVPCGVKCEYFVYQGGAEFRQRGFHHHARPPAKHLGPTAKTRLAATVAEHPTIGPAMLLTGLPRADGPGPSVADISPLLVNLDRIKYERRQILNPANRMRDRNFLDALDNLREEYPNWTINLHWDGGDKIKNEALNGTVSDACHDFWANGKDLLFLSSAFEPEQLKSWVPILMTYSNGATAKHYRVHFLHLFRGIAERCREERRPVTDDLFANVVDFSDAQRLGFVEGFIDFHLELAPEGRDEAELRRAAEALLKGCRQHFATQVNRMSKLAGAVDPDKRREFRHFTDQMLGAKTMDDLNLIVAQFKRAFPHARAWIEWWMRPAHAVMLFDCARVMYPALWKSLPATTNAEEAMHHRIYLMVGRHLPLLKGLKSLIKVADTFERQYNAARAGYSIRYGKDRSWTVKIQRFGRSRGLKPRGQKAPAGAKSDSNPPNKWSQLQSANARLEAEDRRQLGHAPLPTPKKTRNTTGPTLSLQRYQRSPIWSNNSCWLDTASTLLAAALSDHPDEMATRFSQLPEGHILSKLQAFLQLHLSENAANVVFDKDGCRTLTRVRNNFRTDLINLGLARGVGKFDALFGWLHQGLVQMHLAHDKASHSDRVMHSDAGYQALSYFKAYSARIRRCLGSDIAPNEHWELLHPTWRTRFNVRADDHAPLKGDLKEWFKCLVNIDYWESGPCWRAVNSEPFCTSQSALSHDYLLSIPQVLIVDFTDALGQSWKIPAELFPLSEKMFSSPMVGVKYKIIGHAYTDGTHFIARYRTPDNLIFDYDGMKHFGHAVCREKAKMPGWLTGQSSKLADVPDGYRLAAVIYSLEGGHRAQLAFEAERQQNAPLGIQFHRENAATSRFPNRVANPGWKLLADEERESWTTRRHRTEAVEYITEQVPSPVNAKPNIWRTKPAPRFASFDDSDSDDDLPPVRPARNSVNRRSAHPDSAPEDDGPGPDDASVDAMLLETLNSPSPPRNLLGDISTLTVETNSDTPCFINCYGCGVMSSGVDDDEPAVQCEVCAFWTHEDCLTEYLGYDFSMAWDDDEVQYKCPGCDRNPEKLFYFQEMVMLPDPNAGDTWQTDDSVMWYPAKAGVVASRRRQVFHWAECIQWPPGSEKLAENTPSYDQRFCKAIREHGPLKRQQLCQIICPSTVMTKDSWKPPPNHPLRIVFTAALPSLGNLLAEYSDSHPVIESYSTYFLFKNTECRDNPARWTPYVRRWLRSVHLDVTPELEILLKEPLEQLLQALQQRGPELGLDNDDCMRRVYGVGSAMLQLLAVQHDLQEPYDLNGDTFLDMQSDRETSRAIIFRKPDFAPALQAMIRSTKPRQLEHKKYWDEGSFGALYDSILEQVVNLPKDLHPQRYSRLYASSSTPSASIPIDIPALVAEEGAQMAEVEQHIQPEQGTLKRVRDVMDGEIDEESDLETPEALGRRVLGAKKRRTANDRKVMGSRKKAKGRRQH